MKWRDRCFSLFYTIFQLPTLHIKHAIDFSHDYFRGLHILLVTKAKIELDSRKLGNTIKPIALIQKTSFIF